MAVRVGVTSLGCAKNLVDAEVMLGYLRRGGCEICADLNDASVIIVNTCAFIAEAEEESRGTIESLCALKSRGQIRGVVVAGCLPARRGGELARLFPLVDRVVSPGEIPAIAGIVRGLAARPAARRLSGGFLYDHRSPRVRLTPPHYAYVKIAEGCGNRCSYCFIPRIKGPLRSRAIGSVVSEVENLAREGVREVNLIAQDTTAYGEDRYGGGRILELLRRLAAVDGIRWIRLLYGHPARYSDELLEFIGAERRICGYIDFPLQHIADPVLKKMGRRMSGRRARERLLAVRRLVPGAAVRTTFIVGYPGERESHFEELLAFVREARFEHLGAFIYSREEGTGASRMRGQVPGEIKKARFDELMRVQQEVVREANRRMLGSEVEVLIDERLEEGAFRLCGRTSGDAPEVDGTVYLRGDAAPGEFVTARILGSLDYDLIGEVRPEPRPDAEHRKPKVKRQKAKRKRPGA
ncbi:MAG: 30S ribosomal protein S12 methylthiotransferase RimO [Candidatus Aureabacteria bacterium]|nr:30S ribosomal protein S12 methylthiotransferase RimO [Candidatus Auribacterota bacterium]